MNFYIRSSWYALGVGFNERRAKRSGSSEARSQEERGIRDGPGFTRQIFSPNFSSFPVFLFLLSVLLPLRSPTVTSAFGKPLSSERRKLALATLHQYANACSPRHRISINPSTPTLAQITGVRISVPDRTFGVLLLRTAVHRNRTFNVTSTNVGCYTNETRGRGREGTAQAVCLLKSMHLSRVKLSPSRQNDAIKKRR